MKKILMYLFSVLIVVGAGGYFLVKQSYAATPADPLFAVQEIADNVQRSLTFDEVSKTELEQKILVRRQGQVERMAERDDITPEDLEEALQLMAQQRTRVQEKLQTVEQKLEQNEVNENAREAIENVQQGYDENLDRQLETIEKAQEKGNGIGQSVKDDTVEEARNRGRIAPVETPEIVDPQDNIPVDIPVDVEIPGGRGR
jgi:ABC-type Fe3+/spermidine/putrescine transport system ATPase subunit